MKLRKKIILASAAVLGLGMTSCMGMGWSVSSDPYSIGTNVGVYVSGGNIPAPPPPRPLPPRPTPWLTPAPRPVPAPAPIPRPTPWW